MNIEAQMDQEVLRAVVDVMQTQRANSELRLLEMLQKQWDEAGEISDKNLLIEIGYSSPEFFQSCISAYHPASTVMANVDNVDRAFAILSRSRAAIIDMMGIFHARLVNDAPLDKNYDTALSDATREVYTYSCAAVSLVQAYRHLVSGNANWKQEYDDFKTEVFGATKITRFFSDVRNSNNHIHILTPSPHYTIKMSEAREVTSGIRFDREIILQGEKWSKDSKQLVKEREDLQVIDLINEHFRLAETFKNHVLFRIGIQTDSLYRDLLRIKLARKAIGHRVSLSSMLQAAVPKKVNPYPHLKKWFNPDELANIYSLKDHSKEQVDYMISLRDPLGFCDDGTRRKLYELFSAV